MLLGRNELAECFGVTPNTVGAWLRNGAPFEQKGGPGVKWQLDPARIFEWLKERWQEKYIDGEVLNLEQERARLARAQRAKIEQELRVRAGELLEAEEVTSNWGQITSTIRARLLGMPTAAAPSLAKESTPEGCQRIVDSMVRQVLEELSRDVAQEERLNDESDT